MDSRPTVLVADNHAGMLDWIASTLRDEFDIVGAVQDGVSALDGVKRHKPDVLVLDVSMSPMNGFEVMRSLQESAGQTAVILVTTYTTPELEKAALASGARAFILKCNLAEELIPAVRNAVGRGTISDPA